MQKESETVGEAQTSKFRDDMFIAAFGTQNPELFQQLHPELMGVEDESGIEWEVPEDPAEFEEMMNDLHATGYAG